MKIGIHRGLLSTGVIALATIFVLPFGQAANAQTHGSNAGRSVASHAIPGLRTTHHASIRIDPKAAKSLFLSSPYRHTHVHLMPTTAWLRQHSNFQSVARSYGNVSATPGSGLPAPTCTVATDSSVGDAKAAPPGIGQEGPFASLDMSAVGFSTSGGNLNAQIKVVSLTKNGGEPDVPKGQIDNWFAQWTYGGTTYYLRAQYAGGSANTTTIYTYGTVDVEAVETLHVPSGNATGSMNLSQGIVTISVPLSSIGSPKTGNQLTNALFETDVQLGSPLYVTDSQSAEANYPIGAGGSTCPQESAPPKSLPGAVPTSGVKNNLTHYGGPIVHHITNYLIFWLPKTGTLDHPNPNGSTGTTACLEPATKSYNYEIAADPGTDQTYEKVLEQYFKDLPGSSFYNLLTQYSDNYKGAVTNDPAFGGVYFDTCGYSSTPASGVTVPGGTAAAPLYDVDIQNEVQAAMKVNGWKPGLDKEYYVYTGYDAASCFAPPGPSAPEPSCSVQGAPPAYCAYHGDFINSSGTPVLYANMADGAYLGTQTQGLCYSAPIGTTSGVPHTIGGTTIHDWAADAEVAITSHEEFETVSDAMVGTAPGYGPPLGWYSSPNDQGDGEIGDKCAYIYGNYRSDGSNITLAHGDHYIVQLEYSNWANGCSVGDSSVAANPYGGASHGILLLKGWNLINIPTNGITSTEQLEDLIESSEGGTSVVSEIATFDHGRWNISIPDASQQPLTRNEGVFVYLTKSLSKAFVPPGSVYTSPSPIILSRGWNLIGAGWPNPGVMTDSMFNQIEAENGSCSMDKSMLNVACRLTVPEIDAYTPTFDSNGNVNGGQYLPWRSSTIDPKTGHPSWPQGQTDKQTGLFLNGNQIPFTSGMWVHAVTPLTWTPQGQECQNIVNGMCQ